MKFMKFLDNKQMYSVRNVSPMILENWICHKKVISLYQYTDPSVVEKQFELILIKSFGRRMIPFLGCKFKLPS